MDRSLDQQRAQAAFGTKDKVRPEAGFEKAQLQGKNVIITGGASGIGEAALRAFVAGGAVVTFLDKSASRGSILVSQLGSSSVTFVEGDVTVWFDQVRLFQSAASRGPIDTVIANAGVFKLGPGDPLIHDQPGPGDDPLEPDLLELRVNLIGTLYTWKLALHYFSRQPAGRDHSAIFTSSLAAYADNPFAAQYSASKWGVRGLMRSLRASVVGEKGIRVNIVAPSFVRTPFMTDEEWKRIVPSEEGLAVPDDAASAMLHLTADSTIHGRALTVVPRKANILGYEDLDRDFHDFEDIEFLQ